MGQASSGEHLREVLAGEIESHRFKRAAARTDKSNNGGIGVPASAQRCDAISETILPALGA